MPRTNFGHGTPISPEFLNKIARPRIDGLDEDGSLPLITNSNFQNAPGNVVYDFYDYVDRGGVIRDVSGGLNIYVNSSVILGPDNTVITIPARVFNLPDNTITWVSAVRATTGNGLEYVITSSAPPTGVRLARVTTGSGQVISIDDMRYDYPWLPTVSAIATFGGSSPLDYTVPAGQTQILSGTIECRNFLLPINSTIQIRGSLTIRASGTVQLLGQVTTASNPLPWNSRYYASVGGGNTAGSYTLASALPNPQGVGNRWRDQRAPEYNGAFNVDWQCYSQGDRAAFLTFNGDLFGVVGNTSGARFRVNSAGDITVSGSINCSALGVSSINQSAGCIVGSAHPATGLGPQTYNFFVDVLPPQGTAGAIILQSLTRVQVDATATLSARGADSVPGRRWNYSNINVSGVIQTTRSVGAGGGGSIHFQAPTLAVSPSATVTASPGTQASLPANERFDGVGSSGDGYRAATNTAPQPGSITSSTEVPQEG